MFAGKGDHLYGLCTVGFHKHRVSAWLAPFVSSYWVVATQTAHPFGVRSDFGLKFARDSINTA